MSHVRVALVAVALILAGVTQASAQEVLAEVMTWRGAVVKLSQPSLDMLYTIPAAAASPTGGTAAGSTSGPTALSTAGAGRVAAATAVGTGPPPIQARRDATTLTFLSQGVELRVPLDKIAVLAVERRAIASRLPRHVSPAHAQYLASATLTDGTRIDGAQVNFGTTVLRGMGPHGAIELPLEDVQSLKITR